MSAALLLLPLLAQAPAAVASPAVPAAVSNPAPAAADAVRIAGRDVPWPKRTKSVTPTYPPAAAAVGQRGIVIVQMLVGPDGKVASAEVVRSVPPFDAPALSAVRQWEYEVTRVNGQPVPVQLTIPITFALRLPDVTREAGVPEMRQGVAPPFPAGAAPKQPARVTAELTLDSDGQVREAAITGGDPPYTEALLQAVRTWAFVPLSDPGSVSLDVEAVFSGGKEGQRVQMRLFGLREAPSSAAATVPARPAPASTSSPAPAPAAPAPAAPGPATTAAAPVPAAPAASAPPATVTAPSAAPAAPAPAPGGQAPPVEVVPAPPAPKPTDTSRMETGVSAVRDVALTEGVPDLTSGRRPLVPPFARMEGVTGQVQVKFVVEASGATSNIEISGPDRLKEAARQTVSSWTFRRTSTERLFLVTTIDYTGDTARAAVKRQS
jgi:TonB family protein